MGSTKSAGIPNNTGTFKLCTNLGTNRTSVSGSFTISMGSSELTGIDGGVAFNDGWGEVTFTHSASNSNSIYGASSTVQPPAICLRFLIKYT